VIFYTGPETDLTAMVCRDTQDIHILTNMHHPPTNGNFCDEHENTVKPEIIQEYKKYMGYADIGDRIIEFFNITPDMEVGIKLFFIP
jgi:hypothetical protein